jgi:hypothetical protein
MKKTLLMFLLLSASAAFAQNQYNPISINNQLSTPQFFTHPEHAAERSIFASSSTVSAQGERPVSDFPQAEPVSLGTAARELRKQHAQVKKSRVVWINQ